MNDGNWSHVCSHGINTNSYGQSSVFTKRFWAARCSTAEACSVEVPALTWGKGDWKINGLCDWQPMIRGIRLNWIRPGESAGHNPRIHWDTLTVNIQKQFLPSLSLGYKAWLQNTSSPWSPAAWRVSNPNQLKHFKPASHSVPIPRSLYLQRICWWQDVK